jgi:hypothetical protein
MRLKPILVNLACALLLTTPAAAQGTPGAPAPQEPRPAPSAPTASAPAQYWYSPLAWQIALEHRQELGLSPAQVETIERVGTDFTRTAIRRAADLALAQVDLGAVLGSDPEDFARAVDVAKAEAVIREIERFKAELDIAYVRMMEAIKAALTAVQRAALAALLASSVPGGAPAASIASGEPQPGPSGTPAREYWYYCASGHAYYPSVQTCPEPWVVVARDRTTTTETSEPTR